ncbi:MAG: hypothetical protein L0287_05430, partial [Anaerolineae bacterium]|nr:hypothetical protein [Anaerolineae bacterium]
MMESPRVTVLMPLKHYHPLFLSRALDSILQQSSVLWRLLIIVDRPHRSRFRKVLQGRLSDDRVAMISNEG